MSHHENKSSTSVDALRKDVERLRKEGRYKEAAQLCVELGSPAQGAQMYAAVWDWPRAIQTAENAGLFALAFRYALMGEDHQATERLLAILPDQPDQAREAAREAEARGRNVAAARLCEAAGDVLESARLYSQAGEYFDAARCYESVGRYRDAGKLYERRVKEDPTDGPAALRLGRVLAHFGRYDHAARALQLAERDDDCRKSALELQVSCFEALGLHSAAIACLDRLGGEAPHRFSSVADFLQEVFGDPRGLAGILNGQDPHQLLAGRYRVLRSLGAGATGRVLLAHDGFYERDVAIKMLVVGGSMQGRDAYERFAREARIAAGLEHPNVVHVFEFNSDGPFLVMEYMSGGTVQDRLDEENGPLPLAVVHHIGTSVLRGLEAVHRRGVVHRDLKPANIFFGPTGDVKIGDFGISHLQDLGATLTGALLGTLAYMAPEQITGSKRPQSATDLYAFGCILVQMLTGRLPFSGPDYLTQHLEQQPPLVSTLRETLGTRFDTLVQRLLAKDPNDRLSSVDEVRTLFESLDWSDPEENQLEELVRMERGSTASSSSFRSSSIPVTKDRYHPATFLENGAFVARDDLLERNVRVEACDEERKIFLQKLAQADSPYLQAVYDIDMELERCVLEEPQGKPLSELVIDDSARKRIRSQVYRALQALHRVGVTHGNVLLDQVRVAPGRAVLMLPHHPSNASAEDDLRACEEL